MSLHLWFSVRGADSQSTSSSTAVNLGRILIIRVEVAIRLQAVDRFVSNYNSCKSSLLDISEIIRRA